MSELAAQTALSTSGITRIVDRLERRGLVARQLCSADRRSWWTVLTEDGYQVLCADIPPLLDTIQRWLIDPLSAEQLDGLTTGLRALRDAVRPAAATQVT